MSYSSNREVQPNFDSLTQQQYIAVNKSCHVVAKRARSMRVKKNSKQREGFDKLSDSPIKNPASH